MSPCACCVLLNQALYCKSLCNKHDKVKPFFSISLPDTVTKPSEDEAHDETRDNCVSANEASDSTMHRRIARVQKITSRLCRVKCSYDPNANICLIFLQDLTSPPPSEIFVLAVTLEKSDCVRMFQLWSGHDYKVEVKAYHITEAGVNSADNSDSEVTRLQYKLVTKEKFVFCAGEFEVI